jgi:predicted permease
MLGLCAVPLGLLMTGAVLADHATPHVLRGGWSSILLGIGLRLGVLPAIILGMAVLLPADPALHAVLVVQAAMPSAVFPIVLAKIHDGDMPTALRVVLGTSIVGLVTIPLWLTFGLRFL